MDLGDFKLLAYEVPWRFWGFLPEQKLRNTHHRVIGLDVWGSMEPVDCEVNVRCVGTFGLNRRSRMARRRDCGLHIDSSAIR
jgi:hypothetical protein